MFKQLTFTKTLIITLILSTINPSYANILRDPMLPGHLKNDAYKEVKPLPVEPEKVWQLNAITYTTSKVLRSAIVNNTYVKKGSTIEDATVVAINEKTVKLNYKGKSLVLRLTPKIKITSGDRS